MRIAAEPCLRQWLRLLRDKYELSLKRGFISGEKKKAARSLLQRMWQLSVRMKSLAGRAIVSIFAKIAREKEEKYLKRLIY